MRTCSVPGCGKKHKSNGYCATHDTRAKRGTPMSAPISRKAPLTLSSLESRFTPEPNTGCWFWTGVIRPNGYGRTWWRGKPTAAHRGVYELLVSDIPSGMCACHRCDQPSCVNPDHMFLGTHQENMVDMSRKGRGWLQKVPRDPRAGSFWRNKKSCPHGHQYDLKNTRWWRGRRFCRACERARSHSRPVKRGGK